jgi:response regulator NasT
MRTWLLQGKQGEDPGGLKSLLRQWVERPGNSAWRLEVRGLAPDLALQARSFRPDVIVLAAALSPLRATIDELAVPGTGFVVAADESQSESYRDLGDSHSLVFVPPQPTSEMLVLALTALRAALRREQSWRNQVEQLNQRLNDRIVIERAKGVLVQRLGIGEEEAYKRLRVLSRRQRRQIRDIAQSLLDTQALLGPAANGTLAREPPPRGALSELKDLTDPPGAEPDLP